MPAILQDDQFHISELGLPIRTRLLVEPFCVNFEMVEDQGF